MVRSVVVGTVAFFATTLGFPQDCAQPVGSWAMGPANAVAVSGTTAVFNSGPVLQVVDVSNPQVPVVLGGVELAETARDIRLGYGVAYVALGGEGLSIVDISNSAMPHELGRLGSPGEVAGVARLGSFLFLAAGPAGLRVVDVSDPTAPVEVGSLPTPHARNVAARPDWYVMVADLSGLLVVDVWPPSSPVQVGSWSGWAQPLDVATSMTHAFVTDANLAGMLWVVDITDPTNPVWAGDTAFYVDEWPSTVTLEGNLAFVGGTWGRGTPEGLLHVVDVSNPALPLVLATEGTPGTALRVAATVGRAYLADGAGGLRLFDVSNPSNPVETGHVEVVTGALDGVAAVADLAVVADRDSGLRVIDLSDPSAPTQIGVTTTPFEGSRLVVAGSMAYVADPATGLRVADLTEPSAPDLVSLLTMADGARGLDVSGSYAFVAGGTEGLVVVDVSVPSAPVPVVSLPRPGAMVDVAVDEGLAVTFSTTYPHGTVGVVDVTVPSSPVDLGSATVPGQLGRVALDGRRAIVANWNAGIRVVDLFDPTDPQEVGAYVPQGAGPRAADIALVQGHALVADSIGGLRVVNVANPLWPHQVGWRETWRASGVDVRDGLAVLATRDGGILVLDVSDCLAEVFSDGFESGNGAAWWLVVE